MLLPPPAAAQSAEGAGAAAAAAALARQAAGVEVYFPHVRRGFAGLGLPHSSASGFGTTEELKALGFLGAQGDVLRSTRAW